MIDLRFFEEEEFGGWFSSCSPRLLILLDALRFQWGAPIRVSRAQGAIGRRLGEGAKSQHNIDRWGEVRAVDVFPSGLVTREDVDSFLLSAISIGITGIGFYPDWSGGFGFHLDVREDREPGYPATWGRVDTRLEKQYVSIDAAMEKIA